MKRLFAPCVLALALTGLSSVAKADIIVFTATLTGAWSVLALSDGVWKYAGWEAIAKATTTALTGRMTRAIRALPRRKASANRFG